MPDSPLHLDLDPQAGELALTYDDARMSAGDAEALASSLATEALGACACLVRVEKTGGRSCESCADRFAARMRAQPGVRDARASFRGGILRVDYDGGETTPEHLATVVRRLGVATREAEEDGNPWQREAVFAGIALGGLLGGLLAEWQGLAGVSWALYAVAYGFGGWYGARAGFESLRERTVDIDLLMILAALGALAIGAPFEGAMLLFLFSLSNTLQHVAIGRSRRAIEALLELRPDAAHVERDGVWVDVPVEEVRVGDVFRVLPGSRLPLDGVVVSGRSSVDQASITGESVPVGKDVGDAVFGGTTAGDGTLDVRVTKPAGESAIARMIAMVEDAQSQKAETQRLIDRFEGPYSIGVIVMTRVRHRRPDPRLGRGLPARLLPRDDADGGREPVRARHLDARRRAQRHRGGGALGRPLQGRRHRRGCRARPRRSVRQDGHAHGRRNPPHGRRRAGRERGRPRRDGCGRAGAQRAPPGKSDGPRRAGARPHRARGDRL